MISTQWFQIYLSLFIILTNVFVNYPCRLAFIQTYNELGM